MKTKITFFLYLLPFFVFSQTQVNWSSEVHIGGNGYGNLRPRIVVTDDNLPVIIIGDPDSSAVFVTKGSGVSFTTPARVSQPDVNAVVQTWQGPEIAANGNNVMITFKCSPETDQPIYTVKSTDAGVTFLDRVRVDDIGSDVCRFPVVELLPDGNPVVAFMRFDAGFTSPRYVVSNSVDGGLSYLPDVLASVNIFAGEACDCCPANLAANGTAQVMSYRNNDNNIRDIKSVLSFDSGVTFSSGIAVDQTNWLINQCPSTGPDVLINGDSLITVWKSGNSPQRVWVSSSNINTSVVGTHGALNPLNAIQNYPRVAGSNDTIGVVWEEKLIGQTYIKFAYSVTGAQGLFQNPTIISASLNSQTKPDIAYKNGAFHIVWSNGVNNKCTYVKGIIPASVDVLKKETNPVNIFPSPFVDHFKVTTGFGIKSAGLSDATGKTIIMQNANGKSELQFMTGKLEAGTYILILSDEKNQKFTRLLVKE